jgi:hypothetical protein
MNRLLPYRGGGVWGVKTVKEELYQEKGDNRVGVWVHMVFNKTAGRQVNTEKKNWYRSREGGGEEGMVLGKENITFSNK